MALLMEKFWLFGVRPHQDDVFLRPGSYEDSCAHTYRYRSRITPGEGAAMLSAQNMIMVNCKGEPCPFGEDAYGYQESFYPMKKVFWSSTGSGGFRLGNEEKFICELAEKYPNVAGAYLDDLTSSVRRYGKEPSELLAEIREGLDKAPRRLEIYTTWYWSDELYPEIEKYVDGFTFWARNEAEIRGLKTSFESIEERFKNRKKFLGIYLFNFRERKPISNELMDLQCNYALELIKEGRLDGMIFLGNSTMGAGVPSEIWLREWIEKVKYTVVPD